MVNRYGTWLPGPSSKVWDDVNLHDGIILHSMEGQYAVAYQMLLGESQVSWHFSVTATGVVYQHYDIDQSPWHAGNRENNKRFIGIEHEGRVGEPLTSVQLTSSLALVTWLTKEFGWKAASKDHGLFEHGQWYQTSCPNGRIPWAAYNIVNDTAGDDNTTLTYRELDQGDSIAIFEKVATRLGYAITDNAGETVKEITSPAPPQGYRDIVFRVKA